MIEMIIRNFSTKDFDGINVLMNQVHKLHMNNRPDIYKKNDEPLSKKDFLDILNNKNTISILAETGNNIVGLCVVTVRPISQNISLVPRKVAYLEELCVHEEYRKQGIGKKLFVEAKNRVLEFNVDSFELMVWEFNKDAINFYENQGMNTRSRIMELKYKKL